MHAEEGAHRPRGCERGREREIGRRRLRVEHLAGMVDRIGIDGPRHRPRERARLLEAVRDAAARGTFRVVIVIASESAASSRSARS
jgi:hypothetical protein